MGTDWRDCPEADVSVYLVEAKILISFILIRCGFWIVRSIDSADRP